MYRISFASVLVLGAVATANAGQIQIGGVDGITSSYITGNCATTNCLNAPAADGAFTTSSTNVSEINYNTTLFANAQNSSVSPNVPFPTLTDTSAAAVSAAGAGGVTFNLLDETRDSSLDAWSLAGSQSGNQTLDIPINVAGVSSVWTMLNLENSVSAAKEAWVTFDFASSPGATTGLTSVTARLLNSSNPFNAAAAGILQNAILCSATCPSGNYSNGANGPTLTSSVGTMTVREDTGGLTSNTPDTSVTSQVTMSGNTLYDFAYNSGGAGTSGNVVLDDQGFVFSGALQTLAASNYLVDMRVYDNGATGVSGIALSAVTVITPTPEPSTVLLLLTGLGAIGIGLLRRVRA